MAWGRLPSKHVNNKSMLSGNHKPLVTAGTLGA